MSAALLEEIDPETERPQLRRHRHRDEDVERKADHRPGKSLLGHANDGKRTPVQTN
jgi:hypothetical protein